MKITTAKSWSELNEWQLGEIAHLYLNVSDDNFSDAYQKMIFALYQKKPGFLRKLYLHRILRNIPITELEKHAKFLRTETNLYSFPEVPGLIKPADRLGNISIKQYSAIDSFFHAYHNDKSEVHLNRLVASLYRIREEYDELLLPEIGKITSALPLHTKERIALSFKFITLLIWKLYPIIFPKAKDEPQEAHPVFKKKTPKHIPFEKVMIGLAMDELQPLGNKHDINDTRIYEFMNVLTESILYHREKQKQHEKSKK